MKTLIAVLTLAAACLVLSPPPAGAEILISIDDPAPFEVHSIGFELPRDAKIDIDAIGLRPRYAGDLEVYAWILDTETRKPVWVMKPRKTKRVDRSRVLRRAEEKIDLPGGQYELYLFTGRHARADFSNIIDLSGLSKLGALFKRGDWWFGDDDDDWDDWDDDRDLRDRDDDDDWREERREERREELEEQREKLEQRREKLEEHRGELEEHRGRHFSWRDRNDDDDYWDDDDDDWGDDDDRRYRRKSRIKRYRVQRDDDDWGYNSDLEDHIDRCYVKISSDDLTAADVRQFEVTGGQPGALLRFNKVGDSQFLKQGFRLDREMELSIYMLFEYPRHTDGPADFGWIVDADTRERVWHPRRRGTRRAGGGDKNRRFQDDVRLPAGSYILYYGTDDSHSYEEFNVQPPYDPVNWGITVLPGENFDRQAFHTFDAPGQGQALISFDRVGDYDHREQAFRLTTGAKLFVFAMGEYASSDRDFVDHGWIAKASTGEPVWEMTRRNTMPAGGADKNRMFDGVVELPAGEYIAMYVSDDSHSYEEWNAAEPFNPKGWGMTISPGPGFSPASFRQLTQKEITKDPDILAQIVRAGDHERRQQIFTLDASTVVHIYALGEGMGRRMYDYGYIRNEDSGRIVWEMDYRDTRRAGGARKNRLYDDEIRLPAGTYKAVYRTDGSHSFEDWNADQPRDPWNWGMTIRRVR